MKKIIKFFKEFHQQDPEGLYGMIALFIFIYIMYCHIIPIITGHANY
jgi:hypothetical protein